MSTAQVLIDHRHCGGAGCGGCNDTGTALVSVTRLFAPRLNAQTFDDGRQSCKCYEGYSVNDGVAQCTHADHPRAGELCAIEDCPLVTKENNNA